MKLLIDPHGDDAALFAAYTCIAEKPLVVVTHPSVPMREAAAALEALGCNPLYDESFVNDKVDLRKLKPKIVYAPAWREDGHQDHNEVSLTATALFGDKVIEYLTYAPRGQRDRNGTEVIPLAGAVAKKLRALSCYESQIEQESTRPWFTSLLDMREWISES